MPVWLKEMYRKYRASEEELSPSFRRTRRVHEMALLIWGVILLNWVTVEFLQSLFGFFGFNFRSIAHTVWCVFLNIGLISGLVLIYSYRKKEKYLPARSMATYLATAFFWPIGTYGFGAYELGIHAFRELEMEYYIGTIGWFVFLLCIIVPHILWRGAKPTSPILDAILISMLLVLVYKMNLHLGKNQLLTFFPWSMENMPEPVFPSLIAVNWFILSVLKKKPRGWKYPAVFVLNAAAYLLLPTLS